MLKYLAIYKNHETLSRRTGGAEDISLSRKPPVWSLDISMPPKVAHSIAHRAGLLDFTSQGLKDRNSIPHISFVIGNFVAHEKTAVFILK